MAQERVADRDAVLATATSERTALSRAMEQNAALKDRLTRMEEALDIAVSFPPCKCFILSECSYKSLSLLTFREKPTRRLKLNSQFFVQEVKELKQCLHRLKSLRLKPRQFLQ